VTTGTSLDGSTGELVGLRTSLDCWRIELTKSEGVGMMGTSELGRISEEVEATSEISDGGAEVGAASGSGEEVGWATSDEGMTSVVLVAASGEGAASDEAEEASDEGAGKRSETTELRADSMGAGLSDEAGATEVSAAEVAASGEADDSAPEATSVGVGEEADFRWQQRWWLLLYRQQITSSWWERLTIRSRNSRLHSGWSGRLGGRSIGAWVLMSTDLTW
jgi:hypothetical protein